MPEMKNLSIIAGIVHCGSTLLLDMLKASTAVYAHFEVGLLSAPAIGVNEFKHWCNTDPHFPMLQESHGITKADIVALAGSGSWREVYERLFNMLYTKDRKIRPDERTHFIDKTPGYSKHIAAVMNKVPFARVIGLLRDPRAVYASWLKRPNRKMSVAQFADTYNGAMLALLNQAAASPRLLLVRYEHLVDAPGIVLPAICAHLEIDYNPSLCNPENSFRQHVKTIYQFKANGRGRQRETVGGIDRSGIDEYKTHVDVATQELLLSLLDPALFWLAYKPGSVDDTDQNAKPVQ